MGLLFSSECPSHLFASGTLLSCTASAATVVGLVHMEARQARQAKRGKHGKRVSENQDGMSFKQLHSMPVIVVMTERVHDDDIRHYQDLFGFNVVVTVRQHG